MAVGKCYQRQDCSMARALEIIGDRWTLLLVRDCLYGARRFTDLRERLDIPRAVLAERLAALVEAGLLDRRPYRPGREEYLPTERAVALWPVIRALVKWGERYHPAPGGRRRLFRHVPCATDLDLDGHCSTCATLPGPEELETRPGPGANPTPRTDPISRALREPHHLLTPLP